MKHQNHVIPARTHDLVLGESGSHGEAVDTYIDVAASSLSPVAFDGYSVGWPEVLDKYNDIVSKDGTPSFLLMPHIRVLIDRAPTIERAYLYELLFVTGARISEALALSKGSFLLNIDAKGRVGELQSQVELPTRKQRGKKKGKAKRTININSPFDMELAKWLGSVQGRREDRLFKMSVRTVQRWLVEERERHGIAIDITPHTFRHSCAVHLALLGYDGTFIKGYLGHARSDSTDAYLDISIALLQKARPTPNFNLR